MARATRTSKLLGYVEDVDMDEISSNSLVSFPVDSAPQERIATAPKRGRGRPAANKVVKPAKAIGRRAVRPDTTVAGLDTRSALTEKSTNSEAQTITGRRNHASQDAKTLAATGPATAGRRGRPRNALREGPAIETTTSSTAVLGDGMEDGQSSTEIPETQQQRPMELDDPGRASIARSPERNKWRSPVKRTADLPSAEESSAQLRRRIGDLSKRCEAWETKYRDLRDIGVKEAERNFDRLQKQMDARSKAADALVASLQTGLAACKTEAEEGQLHKQRLDAAEAQTSALSAALAEARREVASLTAKLSASRSADTAMASSHKVPGSAVKGSAASRTTASTEALQVAQLKEDLYGDLTGIIIRGVKRDKSGDSFDCILSGRNGTLHFKLIIDADASESYEETQVTYEPQLDDCRDRTLVELLPDYLAGEITFPRFQAAKFLMKLARALEE